MTDTTLRRSLQFDPTFENGDIKLSPDWVSRLFAYAEAEQGVNFKDSLIRQATRHGFLVKENLITGNKSTDFAEAGKHVDQTEGDLKKEVYNRMKMTDIDEIITVNRKLVENQQSDPVIKEQLDCAHTLKNWPEKLGYDDYLLARENRSKIFNLTVKLKAKTENVLRQDVNRLIKNPGWTDITYHSVTLTHELIDDCLSLCGFQGVLDSNTEVNENVFRENCEKIIQICSQSRLSRKGRIQQDNTSDELKLSVSALRRELKEMFGVSLKRKRSGKNRCVSFHLEIPQDLVRLATTRSYLSQDVNVKRKFNNLKDQVHVSGIPNKRKCMKSVTESIQSNSSDFDLSTVNKRRKEAGWEPLLKQTRLTCT